MVLSMVFIGVPWLLHNLFTVVFEKKYLKGYLKKLGGYCLYAVVVSCLTLTICSKIAYAPIQSIIYRGIICCILPNLLFLLAYRKKCEYKETLQLVDKMTEGKIRIVLDYLGMNSCS